MGGFECATHRRRDRSRLDLTAATGHDVHCAQDYSLLREAGVRTVRDGLRWYLIEGVPGIYDWSSLLPLIHAANETGTQVLWDICHWGVPDWLDIFSPEFPDHFAAFAAVAVSFILEHRTPASDAFPDLFCAVNEISFWAWVGGDEEHFHPFAAERGNELKRQLVCASLAAIRAARVIDPTLQFVQPEPMIDIASKSSEPEEIAAVALYNLAQLEAFDMLLGLNEPQLGGFRQAIDFIGVNYYWNNQWIDNGDRKPPGHPLHRSIHLLLEELWQRYRLPIVITETGAESDAAIGWLGYISAEVRQAQRAGVPILGICLYPVMDYPGWDDERHCHCGLIEATDDWTTRQLRADITAELHAQQQLFETRPGHLPIPK